MRNTNVKEEFSPIVIISKDRERTNILKKYEQKAIAYLVQRVPDAITSDMLTAFGFLGNVTVFLSMVLAAYYGQLYLLLGVLGFVISWFGDSLDGRIAYYRNKQRKWYGFTLDFITDWLGIILIGYGFMVYSKEAWEIFGFAFVVLYGWEMMISLLRYKVTGNYSIDSGKFGPTEVRILISSILILEAFVKDSIIYPAVAACVVIFVLNLIDTVKLLKVADARDKEEKKAKENA